MSQSNYIVIIILLATCIVLIYTNQYNTPLQSLHNTQYLLAAHPDTTNDQQGTPHHVNTVHSNTVPATLSINEYRLMNVYNKLLHNQPVTIGVVGGSNSVGVCVMNRTNIIYDQFINYLNMQYTTPNNHTLINSARSATTSESTSWCIHDLFDSSVHQLANQIDLLFVDFAVNDIQNDNNILSMDSDSAAPDNNFVVTNVERLVRNIQSTSRTALFFLYFAQQNDRGSYTNTEQNHEIVAQYYSIPSISLKNHIMYLYRTPPYSYLLDTAFNRDYRTQEDIQPDIRLQTFHHGIHATDLGHTLFYSLLRDKFNTMISAYQINYQANNIYNTTNNNTIINTNYTVHNTNRLVTSQPLLTPLSSDNKYTQFGGGIICQLIMTRHGFERHYIDQWLSIIYSNNFDFTIYNGRTDKAGLQSAIQASSQLIFETPVDTNTLTLLYLRSWKSMSNCTATVNNNTDVQYHIDGHWDNPNSQLAMYHIPLPIYHKKSQVLLDCEAGMFFIFGTMYIKR